ncbi:MAG: glycosyltransferase [Pseudolabrys sp.]|nr:glycosyltransferase [Pseudolabrys sp.]MDP2295609.1 glycosyltransferase [Pseudolabrys sp.]
MRQLNILHVLRAPVGGLFRHVLDLVQGQIARGHNVGIVADSLTGDAASELALAHLVPLLALGLSRTPIKRPFGPRDLTAFWHVSRRLRATRADVVHGHGAKGGAFARLAFAGKPTVRAYTPHGGSLLLDHATRTGKAYLALERILMPRGDLYLFESAYSAAIFDARIGKPKGLVRVVHNGVRPNEFEPVALANDATDLVFLGELRPVKGIDVLIDAIAHLRDNGAHHVTATIVGGGPLAEDLLAQAERLGLSHAIRFMPPMPARAAMALGRVMVIPSRAESLPYVVLEAGAAGKPLITTNVGGIPEIYGPLSDALVPAGDVPQLSSAIARAMSEPEAMIGAARALRTRVERSFSCDAMVDGVLAGYEQALARLPAHSRPALAHA